MQMGNGSNESASAIRNCLSNHRQIFWASTLGNIWVSLSPKVNTVLNFGYVGNSIFRYKTKTDDSLFEKASRGRNVLIGTLMNVLKLVVFLAKNEVDWKGEKEHWKQIVALMVLLKSQRMKQTRFSFERNSFSEQKAVDQDPDGREPTGNYGKNWVWVLQIYKRQ